LSVSEFLLVEEAGYEIIELVAGDGIVHTGYQPVASAISQPMQTLTKAMSTARSLATQRMREEAVKLEAHGIVGVRLEIEHEVWGENIVEFMAIGTAVRRRGGTQAPKFGPRLFTSNLSGQDLWSLTLAGYRPLALVFGNCVYHVARQGIRQAIQTSGQNMEMTAYTTGLYEARRTAMGQMAKEAGKVQATGVVGVEVTSHSHTWGSHVIEFLAVGTAIVESTNDQDVAAPGMVLGLGAE
jgi:uncharacterized protein YbjQ (UPF0145 family)